MYLCHIQALRNIYVHYIIIQVIRKMYAYCIQVLRNIYEYHKQVIRNNMNIIYK